MHQRSSTSGPEWLLVDLDLLFNQIYDQWISWGSLMGRIKDIFKTLAGCQVSPLQVEDVLLSEPQGLIAEVIIAGVLPSLLSPDDDKGLLISRAWIVLSDKGKKLGKDAVMKELEAWYQEKLSNHKWLHGGFEFVDEVCNGFFSNTAWHLESHCSM